MTTVGAAIFRPSIVGRHKASRPLTRPSIGRLFFFASILLAACRLAVCRADDPPSLGNRVLEYCKQHQGKRVGNASCTVFVAAALQSAGARLHGPDAVKNGSQQGPSDDFNWGELVFVLERVGTEFKTKGDIRNVRPGDIIQFTRTTLSGPLDDSSTYTMTARHHTAIVAGVLEHGTVLNIYHQGANGRKVVSTDQLRLLDLQRGRFTIFHPIAKTASESTPTSSLPKESEDSTMP
jgi:hypothetical protein